MTRRLKWVGAFIKERREIIGLSQRRLALMLQPVVTTQFISNIERGVTPLPVGHIPTLAIALQVTEGEILDRLHRDFELRISQTLGRDGVELPVECESAVTEVRTALSRVTGESRAKLIESVLRAIRA